MANTKEKGNQNFLQNILEKHTFLTYFLSFLFPAIIICLAFILLHITPFGDNTITISDGYGLYLPEIAKLKRMFQGSESIFYSFTKGLGGTSYNLFWWHLSDPFYLLFLFFPLSEFTTCYSLIIIFQTAFSGLTMYYFLNHLFNDKAKCLLFSTIYALNGYAVAYCWNLMWMNGVIILPLITLGILNILRGKSSLLYFFSIVYAILTNFYIGFSLCFFSLFFFLAFSWCFQIKKKEIWIKYGVSSILAGFSTSFAWLPSVLSLRGGRMNFMSFPPPIERPAKIIETLAKLFPNFIEYNQYIKGQANIYCTLFVVALVFLFFISSQNEVRTKKALGSLIFIYFFSFIFSPLALLFQGFSIPFWFPFRYSFIFSFLLILIACYQFHSLENITDRELKFTIIFVLSLGLIVYLSKINFLFDSAILIELLICLILLLTLPFGEHNSKINIFEIYGLISFLLLGNLIFTLKSIDFPSLSENRLYVNNISSTLQTIKQSESEDSFYRLHIDEPDSSNNPAFFGYNGVSHFSSTESMALISGERQYGISQIATMNNNLLLPVPLACSSFLGIKYLISENENTGLETGFELKEKEGEYYIFQNDSALPFFIECPNGLGDLNIEGLNPFETQNVIWKYLTGKSDNIYTSVENAEISIQNKKQESYKVIQGAVLKEVTADDLYSPLNENEEYQNSEGDTLKISFVAQEKGDIYLYKPYLNSTINGSKEKIFEYLGNYKQGDKVETEIYFENRLSEEGVNYIANNISLYYENRETIKSYSELIPKAPNGLNGHHNKIEGNINVGKDTNYILLTVPYNSGWTAKIDGQTIKPIKVLNIFMALPISSGNHQIEMIYYPVGFKFSVIFSIVSFLTYGLIFIVFKKLIKKSDK